MTEFVFLRRGLRDMTSALEEGEEEDDRLPSRNNFNAEKVERF